MFGSRLVEQGKALVAATASAWRCPCWDCRAQRRRLLRLAAMGTLALASGGGAAWELGRRHGSAAGLRERGVAVAVAGPASPGVPGFRDT